MHCTKENVLFFLVFQVIAMSSRSWLSYWYQNRFHLTPLSYDSLEYASGFASEQCPEGIVAISTNTLRILALEKLGAVFNQVIHSFKYTKPIITQNNKSGIPGSPIKRLIVSIYILADHAINRSYIRL
jgi:hypothetical protein